MPKSSPPGASTLCAPLSPAASALATESPFWNKVEQEAPADLSSFVVPFAVPEEVHPFQRWGGENTPGVGVGGSSAALPLPGAVTLTLSKRHQEATFRLCGK